MMNFIEPSASRKGFTLVELLVTIAIIAILSSILLPALGAARARSRDIACRSNIRSLSLPLTLYQNDFNDYLPSYDPANSWEGIVVNMGYVNNNMKFFTCPSQANQTLSAQVTYGNNRYLFSSPLYDTNHVDGNVRVIKTRICDTIVLGEKTHTWNDVNGGAYHHPQLTALHARRTPSADIFYMPCNFLFLDGHAELKDWTGSYIYGGPTYPLFKQHWFVKTGP